MEQHNNNLSPNIMSVEIIYIVSDSHGLFF